MLKIWSIQSWASLMKLISGSSVLEDLEKLFENYSTAANWKTNTFHGAVSAVNKSLNTL